MTVYDALSGLNYMQARYQNPSRGQFVSEDPNLLAIGTPEQLRRRPYFIPADSGDPASRPD